MNPILFIQRLFHTFDKYTIHMFEVTTIKDVKNSLGEWCKELRKFEDVTQEELGLELGLSRLTISKLENGENPTLETLLKVLQHFGEMNSLHEFMTHKIELLTDQKSMY